MKSYIITAVILTLLLLIYPACLQGNDQKGAESGKLKAIPNKNITIEQLKWMFSNISKDTKWDMKKPMLWGYSFTHREPSLLEKAKDVLVSKGYKFVSISLSEKEDKKDPDLWWLHVEMIEIHTPESLDQRNDEFYIFAHEFGLDSYDGMDFGPVKH